MRDVKNYMRANPQVFVLLVICVVLGLGTFLAVLIGLAASGGGHPTGDPNESFLMLLRAALAPLRPL
jgi:hypothetical protein